MHFSPEESFNFSICRCVCVFSKMGDRPEKQAHLNGLRFRQNCSNDHFWCFFSWPWGLQPMRAPICAQPKNRTGTSADVQILPEHLPSCPGAVTPSTLLSQLSSTSGSCTASSSPHGSWKQLPDTQHTHGHRAALLWLLFPPCSQSLVSSGLYLDTGVSYILSDFLLISDREILVAVSPSWMKAES